MLKLVYLVALVTAYTSIFAGNKNCPKTRIVNKTKVPFNTHDGKQIFKATVRCPEIFEGHQCLIEFRKTGENAYQAICGRRK